MLQYANISSKSLRCYSCVYTAVPDIPASDPDVSTISQTWHVSEMLELRYLTDRYESNLHLIQI